MLTREHGNTSNDRTIITAHSGRLQSDGTRLGHVSDSLQLRCISSSQCGVPYSGARDLLRPFVLAVGLPQAVSCWRVLPATLRRHRQQRNCNHSRCHVLHCTLCFYEWRGRSHNVVTECPPMSLSNASPCSFSSPYDIVLAYHPLQVLEECEAGNKQVIDDVRRITGRGGDWLPSSPRELASILFHTCYMGSENRY